ncbi:MAG: hypothetical protein PWQ06_1120 [Anaerophaga sp.]|nr:hypothetical protein [Anaerophaga sp.]
MANLTRQEVLDLKEAFKIYRPSVQWMEIQTGESFKYNPYHFRDFYLHDNHHDIWKALQGNPTDDVKAEAQILLDEWFANMLVSDSDGQIVLDQYYANR